MGHCMSETWFRVPAFRLTPLPQPEIRHDPLTGVSVIYATTRADRPCDMLTLADPAAADPSGQACPFCVGNEDQTPPAVLTVPAADGSWAVRAVPNRYPALGDTATDPRHFVVIEWPAHQRNLSICSVEQIAAVLDIHVQLMLRLRAKPDIQFVQSFKNVGPEAGASLVHSHSQVLALPFIPLAVQRELVQVRNAWTQSNRCPQCETLREEYAEGQRLIAESGGLLAYAPRVSRMPCEVRIVPITHASRFEASPPELISELAGLLKLVLTRLDQRLAEPPYNLTIRTVPTRLGELPYVHWSIDIVPRLTGLAGFEWATDCYINPVPPEQAAAYLR